jgi:hypothetical protein
MEYSEALANLNVLLSRDPAGERLYIDALERCRERIDEQAAADFVDGKRTAIQQIQSGSTIIATLIRRGGLERTILVDGEPYEGDLVQLQTDDNVPDEAVIETYVQTTPAGIDLAAGFRETTTASALFAEFPQFEAGLKKVLDECTAPEGKSTQELQDALIEAGIIGPGNTQSQIIHASYFTGKLEKYELLVWSGKKWHTTSEGKEAL